MIDVGVVLEGGEAETSGGYDEGDAGVGLFDRGVERRAVDTAAEGHLVLEDEEGAGRREGAGAGEAKGLLEEMEEGGVHARSGYMVGVAVAGSST
jgi:hypothetical protein